MLSRIRAALIATMLAAGTVVGLAPTASAASVYKSDECEVSGNDYCMVLFYNSRQGSAIWASSCFIASKSIPNYAGYYAGDGIQVYYVFAYRDKIYNHLGYCSNGSGDGQGVKNNAAAASNNIGRTWRVHYNSNYGGIYQTVTSGEIENLNADLKNENASGKML
jgi:hypothetical protein